MIGISYENQAKSLQISTLKLKSRQKFQKSSKMFLEISSRLEKRNPKNLESSKSTKPSLNTKKSTTSLLALTLSNQSISSFSKCLLEEESW